MSIDRSEANIYSLENQTVKSSILEQHQDAQKSAQDL